MRTLFIKSLLAVLISSTSFVHGQNPLDEYINQGLENNIVMQQKNISLEKAHLALKIARGMFMPSVGLQGSYTHGDGGRNISVPFGDLLNPVYRTLNQLTNDNQFPEVENLTQNFLPENFYDVHVRTSVPLFNRSLHYYRKIEQNKVIMQGLDVKRYQRDLIRDIKVAYFNYLAAEKTVQVSNNALQRAHENRRVNKSLLDNGKGLPAYVIRSQSEIETLKAQLTEAEKQVSLARMHFNFLINRGLEEPIDGTFQSVEAIRIIETRHPEATVLPLREEIRQLHEHVTLQSNVLRMNQQFWAPTVSAFVDLGSQYEDWRFNSQSSYYLVGLMLEVPLFAGFTNRNKIRQSEFDLQIARLDQTQLAKQLDLGQRIAMNEVESAYQNYKSALKQNEAARSYQKLIEKGYGEGVNTFIEYLDANSQLTSTELLVSINQYKLLVAVANYEREKATYSLTK
jgi:outer membrane protein TolC